MILRATCDASALVALVLKSDHRGDWVAERVRRAELSAPSAVLYEAANAIRGLERGGQLTGEQAEAAHADVLGLELRQVPYGFLADRIWTLRHNLTAYDAAYVAVAELLNATLITLDHRIAAVPGIRCQVASPRPV